MRTKKIIFLWMVFLVGMEGCKKGGPTVPYDSLAPAVSGNTTVNAIDSGKPVSGLVVDVLEPNGTTLTGVTGSNGTWTFDYNYAAETVSAPMTVVSLPQTLVESGPSTNVYGLSVVIVPPGTSSVPLTCASATDGNTLTLDATGNTLYGYALTTNLIYDTTYDVPGSLNVPVSFYSPNMPYGWEISGPSSFLQGVSQTIPVTLSVPAYQYQTFTNALPLTVETIDLDNASNIRGQAEIPVSRNFAVSVYAYNTLYYSETSNGSDGPGKSYLYSVSGSYSINENIPIPVDWTGTYTIGVSQLGNGTTYVYNFDTQQVNIQGDYVTVNWQAPATELEYGFGGAVTNYLIASVSITSPLGTYQQVGNAGQIDLTGVNHFGGESEGSNSVLYSFYTPSQSF